MQASLGLVQRSLSHRLDWPLCALIVSSILLVWIAGRADEQSVKPGINDTFKDPRLNVNEWVGRFETESREVFAQRQQIVKTSGVKPGWQVADVGAGTGLFSLLFADAVGTTGRVYAVDIAQPFLKEIRQRALKAGHANIQTILGTDKDTKLPADSVNLVFFCDTYHHFEFPQDTLASIHHALRPGGLIVLVDFKRIPGQSSDWTLNHVRAGQDVFEKEIEAAGFKKLDEPGSAFLHDNYLVRFRKK